MEFSNQNLQTMSLKKSMYNAKYARWFYAYFKELGGELLEVDENGRKKLKPTENSPARYLFNRGENIENCMNLWSWDKYEQNKILDLQRVNRCKNRGFCPNCRRLNVSRLIHEFRAIMPELIEKYDMFLMTLTVPSVAADMDGSALKALLDSFPAKFKRLNERYSAPKLTPTGKRSSLALQDRYFEFAGGMRILELTYNEENGFHPHYHCLVLVEKGRVDDSLLEKKHIGKWSKKKEEVILKSDIDIQISKCWSMLWQGISLAHWDKYEYVPYAKYMTCNGEQTKVQCLECDFIPFDGDGLKGVKELFKYTFKDSDIQSYRVFVNYVNALDRKRFRQGFGVLHNFKCEEFDEGEAQPLNLAVMEEPEKLLTSELAALWTEYKEYKKISRFNKAELIDDTE